MPLHVLPTTAAFVKLHVMRHLTFTATSDAAAPTGWAGTGVGTVTVERTAGDRLVYREQGTFTPAVPGRRPTAFANVYRWTVAPDRLRLAHLRLGPRRPVVLFDLVPDGDAALVSAEPHPCGGDRYAARLAWSADAVELVWTVTGPAKAERIVYAYRR